MTSGSQKKIRGINESRAIQKLDELVQHMLKLELGLKLSVKLEL